MGKKKKYSLDKQTMLLYAKELVKLNNGKLSMRSAVKKVKTVLRGIDV